jgi:general secretion pathway protein E
LNFRKTFEGEDRMSGAVAELDGSVRASAAKPHSVEQLLLERGLLGEEAAERARMAAFESGERFATVATRLGLVSETALAEALSAQTGLPLAGQSDMPATALFADRLSMPFLRENRCLPIAEDDTAVTVALVDPFDDFVLKSLAFAVRRPVNPVLARASDIDAAIDRLAAQSDGPGEASDGFVDETDIERLKDLVSDAPVIRAVNRLIAEASDARASDIHIEPGDDRLAVRFRIDGVLRERDSLPPALRAPLVSRIKVMAGLNIAERRLPQDGRMRIAVRGHEIDLRVATVPSISGESVVMRILDRSKLALDFAALGFDAALAAQLREVIARPHGIVLVTGPTGSGKTTTLYAALAELNGVERKLLTIEDPIEYRLPGVVQAQVNPQIGFTFGAALRSFLRLDPDVMMVGEIRDAETAQIAVQAALTGHLILSTLHTNSAAGAVTRLADMEVEPFLLASVLAGVLAQRLARRLCADCAEPFVPPGELLADLGLDLTGETNFRRAVGCPRCSGSGYSGRIALFEFLKVDAAVARLVLHRASTAEVLEAALAAGMRSLRQDALAKAAAGLTTIEEAVRVTAAD